MRRLLALGFALLLLLGGGMAVLGWRDYAAPGPLAAPAQLVVPRGGTEAIAGLLAEKQVIASPWRFALAAWLTREDGPLRAGEFVFPAQASLRDVLGVLREGRMVQRRLTIPEGLTARQISALVDRAEGLSGETPAIAEGSILPETYGYALGDTRAGLVRRAATAMEAALAEAWANRAEGLPLNAPREALILASIVERETGVAAERAQVASVFVNRLRRGMMLQSDPTVAYVAGQGMPLERAISRADLDAAHPFNTYRIRGLPPGPIAMPGREALRAVTRPDATEYLFFVADGTGGHAFARTLEEHNRNVARWRALGR